MRIAYVASSDIRRATVWTTRCLKEEKWSGFAERARIERLRQEGALSEEARRRIERELDFEEARINQTDRDPA